MARRKVRSRLSRSRTYRGASNMGTSRRFNREKKKVMRQTIIMAIVSIIVLLIFIFVIIPGFFRLTTNFFDSSNPFQQSDNIAPQVPLISSPVTATSSAKLKVVGFGEPESDLIVVLNGSKEEPLKISEDGSFELDITLDEGENTISAYSIDKAENESGLTRDYIVLLDTSVPKLEISEPEDGASFESRANQSVTLKGSTDTDAKIYVNRRVVFPNDEGDFEHTLRLEEGENTIEIKAEDKAKNSTTLELKLNFAL